MDRLPLAHNGGPPSAQVGNLNLMGFLVGAGRQQCSGAPRSTGTVLQNPRLDAKIGSALMLWGRYWMQRSAQHMETAHRS